MLAIVGPTASGKSALAMEVARRMPAEIVACDSLQVYAGMDIGTGKPTVAERDEIPHHLCDVAPPTEPLDAARWAELAREAVGGICARGRTPLVVGGTGLYLRALTAGLFAAPPPDAEIRRRHREEAGRLGVEALHARLAAIDPATAARIQPRDLMRVSRALEVHEQTGVPISELHRRGGPEPAVIARVLVLDPPLDDLRARIASRVDAMMAAGFLDEVRRLRAAFGADARPLRAALGYQQLGEHLDGGTTLEAAAAATKAATVAYARRQRTWFRRQPGAWRAARAPEPGEVVRRWASREAGAWERTEGEAVAEGEAAAEGDAATRPDPGPGARSGTPR